MSGHQVLVVPGHADRPRRSENGDYVLGNLGNKPGAIRYVASCPNSEAARCCVKYSKSLTSRS